MAALIRNFPPHNPTKNRHQKSTKKINLPIVERNSSSSCPPARTFWTRPGSRSAESGWTNMAMEPGRVIQCKSRCFSCLVLSPQNYPNIFCSPENGEGHQIGRLRTRAITNSKLCSERIVEPLSRSTAELAPSQPPCQESSLNLFGPRWQTVKRSNRQAVRLSPPLCNCEAPDEFAGRFGALEVRHPPK